MARQLLLKLKNAVKNKKYLDDKILKSINHISLELKCDWKMLLDLILKYLENYPQQISLLYPSKL